jgi:hypothetical protein
MATGKTGDGRRALACETLVMLASVVLPWLS